MIDIRGRKLASWDKPCACCGADYSPNPVKSPTAKKGINIIPFETGSNVRRKTTELSHVKTRNGVVTIVVKLED